MKCRIEKAYKHITTFLLQPHTRNQFLDEHIAIALYSTPLSLYIFAGRYDYFKASVSLNRGERWIEEGYKYEDDKRAV